MFGKKVTASRASLFYREFHHTIGMYAYMYAYAYIHTYMFTLLYFTLKPPIRSGRINTTTTVTGWLIGPEIGIHPNSPPGDGVDYKALGPRL